VASEDTGGSRRGRRNDPERRDRIIDAALRSIARDGVAGTSHRKVAAEADVPLGAMTYYFDGMDALLREAFTRFATTVSDRFERRMVEAGDRDAARIAVGAMIVEDVFGDDSELVLSHELYTLAARDPSFRSITAAWMARSRAALERHFDADTARLIDAMIEGLTIHRALDAEPRGAAEVTLGIERITALATPPAAACASSATDGHSVPEIVCICGSARFAEEMRRVNLALTLDGVIVVAPGEADSAQPISVEQKRVLDALHLRKIDLADRVLVVNPGGYVGESTRREIDYARAAGKPVSFTHPTAP